METQVHARYTVKIFSIFPSPAGMSLTKLSQGVNYGVISKLFPPRGSLLSDILAGDGNIEKLFLQCTPVAHRPASAVSLHVAEPRVVVPSRLVPLPVPSNTVHLVTISGDIAQYAIVLLIYF
jgi:hypothetical protein